MRKLILGFILLLIAIWIGFLIHKDSGYVLISYDGWTLETSLWATVITIIVFFIVLTFILGLIRNTRLLGNTFHQWTNTQKTRKARKLTNLGLCTLAEGDWQRAERNLIKATKDSNSPLINYLAAARAAQEQRAYNRRNYYLRKALESTKDAEIAVGLTQAQLQIDSKQWELALATLKHLQQIAPNHKFILKLLQHVFLELHDWKQLKKLLPDLRNNQILHAKELKTLEEKIYLSLLNNASKMTSNDSFKQTWYEIPKSWRNQPSILKAYIHYLIKRNLTGDAISIIENTLKKQWNPDLVACYGLARCHDTSAQQLTTAEAWLKKHPKEPELLLCLGRLSLHEKFLGKAKNYLESCLSIKPLTSAYLELGKVYEALDDKNAALNCYRQAATLSSLYCSNQPQ